MELYSTIVEAAQKYANSIALDGDVGRFTYAELFGRSNVLGHALLRRFGAERRNVALLIPNTPYFPLALFGLLGAGHVAVPFNPLLNPEELAVLLSHGECGVLIYDPVLEDKARQAAELAQIDVAAVSAAELLQDGEPDPSPLAPAAGEDDLSMILYTSGTTGDPKGVMLSHQNIHSNVISFCQVFDFNEKDTFPCVLPLFHTFAMTVVLFGALVNGARIVLFPQFSPQKLVETIMTQPNIILLAVPPMLMMTARFAPPDAAEKHNLRVVASGGGPLPSDVFHYFDSRFQHPILEGYGLTETSPAVAVNRPGINRVGTIGLPLPGVKVEMRDENGSPVPGGEVGELCVQGDLVMKGYYKNPAATEAVFFEDGWLRTGDLGMKLDEGFLRIVGRSKDVILCGGENIYPREIEETLMRFPGVTEAAVVAKADALRTETPFAFIAVDENAEGVTESALRKHCRQHLGEYKVPVGFQFLPELPKTATRKIQKEKLRDLLRKEND
ncbi:MAG: AMP-binding protein [bacterium]|nr:AMP-binding protein [bacterium]